MNLKYKLLPIWFLLFLLIFSPISIIKAESAFQNKLENMTVFQLLEKQTELDGKEISFDGEVIGQPIFDKNGVFINLMDHEFNALGVYLDKSMLTTINHYGRDGQKGDYVRVTGIFHKVCLQHGGDTDLHVTKLSMIKPGERFPSKRTPPLVIGIGIILPIVTFVLYYLTKKKD